jgi:hypothetical protein
MNSDTTTLTSTLLGLGGLGATVVELTSLVQTWFALQSSWDIFYIYVQHYNKLCNGIGQVF